MKTESEKQLKKFLKAKKDYRMKLILRPQGDIAGILKEPINLCEVNIGSNTYSFGGISEDFYDKMVDRFHDK